MQSAVAMWWNGDERSSAVGSGGRIYALVGFAGRVYSHGLLHSGPRLSIRTAWRLTNQP